MGLRDTSVNAEAVFLCKFGRIIDALDQDDMTILTEWINVKRFGAPKIRKGLNEVGESIGQDAIGRHLVANCGCPEGTPFFGVRNG